MKQLLGEDLILFDSELVLLQPGGHVPLHSCGCFPVEPESGASLVVPLFGSPAAGMTKQGRFADLERAKAFSAEQQVWFEAGRGEAASLLVLRYFPATARLVRDPQHPAHRARAKRQLLIDSTRLPLWQVSGVDRAGNDFVTGFDSRTSRWSVFPALTTDPA